MAESQASSTALLALVHGAGAGAGGAERPAPREVRSSLPGKRKGVLFGFHDGELIALHAFIKETQKTSQEDLARARQRLKEATT